MMLPHIVARVFNTPLMINRAKLDTILAVLKPRLEGEPVPFTDKPARRSFDVTPQGIAIIPIIGTLVRRSGGLDALSGLASYDRIGAQFDEAMSDNTVKAILLDIDSPGGEAGGVFDLADKVFAARGKKTVWAVSNEDAFSAAYAIAAAAERIYVSRTAGVGSIGVIAVHLDQSIAEASEGLTYTAVYAGERKNDMTPHEPLTDPARAILQDEVNRVYDLFAGSVARMRKMDIAAVKATEAGIYMSDNAIAAGLADKPGTFDDALEDLRAKLATPVRTPLLASRNSKTKGAKMNTPDTPDDVLETLPENPDAPPNLEALRAQAHGDAMAYMAEVTQLCQLAGLPDKAADLIARQVPVAEVRKALLEAKAITAEATTISGHIPSGQTERPKAKIDTAAIYAKRNAPRNPKKESN